MLVVLKPSLFLCHHHHHLCFFLLVFFFSCQMFLCSSLFKKNLWLKQRLSEIGGIGYEGNGGRLVLAVAAKCTFARTKWTPVAVQTNFCRDNCAFVAANAGASYAATCFCCCKTVPVLQHVVTIETIKVQA